MSTSTMFRLEGRIDSDAFFALYDLFSDYGDTRENETAQLLLGLVDRRQGGERVVEAPRNARSLLLIGEVSEHDLYYVQMAVEEVLDCCRDEDLCSALDRALDQLARMTHGASLRLA